MRLGFAQGCDARLITPNLEALRPDGVDLTLFIEW
jgi:hypothetical protein